MTVIIVIVITLVLVVGLGILIFSLMRRTPKVVPDLADRKRAEGVVAIDDDGRPVLASDEEPPAPHDDAAFEDVLKDELDDLRG